MLRFQNDELPMVTPIREAFEAEHGSIERGEARRLWKQKYMSIGTQTRGQEQPGYGRSDLRDVTATQGRLYRRAALVAGTGRKVDTMDQTVATRQPCAPYGPVPVPMPMPRNDA